MIIIKIFSIIILLLFFSSQSQQQQQQQDNIQPEVIQVQFFSRHGDRLPMEYEILPKYPSLDIFKKLQLPPAILTALGERQCYILGKSMRERYIDQKSLYVIKGLINNHGKYNVLDYQFHSDYCKRTIRSAWSITKGLFPDGKGWKLDIYPYEYSLPNGSSSIPIMIDSYENDRVIVEYDICPMIFTRIRNYFDSKEGKEKVRKYDDIVKKLNDVTGMNISFRGATKMLDLFVVMKNHELLPEVLEKYYDTVVDLSNDVWKILFNRTFIGKLTGNFVHTVLTNMDNFISNQSLNINNHNNGRYNPIYNVFEENTIRNDDDSQYKFIHYSGHDSGIAAILANLRLRDDYPELNIIPPYGSALIFELLHEKGIYYVQILVKLGFDGPFKAYRLKSYGGKGCEDVKCEFKQFKSLVNIDSYVPENEWCKECKSQALFCQKYL